MAHVIERLEHPGAAAAWLDARRGASIGFVPTMGALHAGHLALVACARAENELVVVSVFVNPLPFDDAGDLAAYPRDLERDAELLSEAGCDLVFTGVLCGPGGFHEIDLTMLAIDLVDRISVRWIDDGVVRDGAALVEALTVGLSGPAASADIPADGSNLAARAAGLVLGQLVGALPAGRVALPIDKCIPSRAGLGGGSSDAAAALIGTLELVRLLGLGGGLGSAGAVPPGLCARLAELGSDCAFFLEAAGLARCRGRGERVAPGSSSRS